MTKPSNIPAIERATGITWEQWLAYLEKLNAKTLTHKQIAKLVYEKLKDKESAGWWSQGVTVAYEQEIGRREPGQRNDGSFETSASKTVHGTMDEVLEKWAHLTADRQEFNGVALEKGPSQSETDKWRNWHCAFSDGSRVTVGIYQKSPDKALLGLGHLKLKSAEDAENWKKYWKTLLEEL